MLEGVDKFGNYIHGSPVTPFLANTLQTKLVLDVCLNTVYTEFNGQNQLTKGNAVMTINFYSEFFPKTHKSGKFISSFRRAKYINHSVSFNIYSRIFDRNWSLVVSWINPNGKY